MERSIDRMREWKPGGAYVKRGAGGGEGTCCSYYAAKDRMARPPSHRRIDIFRALSLTLGLRSTIDVEADDDKLTSGATGARCKGGSPRSGVERSSWATSSRGGGFSPVVSPLT